MYQRICSAYSQTDYPAARTAGLFYPALGIVNPTLGHARSGEVNRNPLFDPNAFAKQDRLIKCAIVPKARHKRPGPLSARIPIVRPATSHDVQTSHWFDGRAPNRVRHLLYTRNHIELWYMP